ncbi:hypothetical protein COU59_00410, partial [Candidatus Pacearchaeota archaeon CG10_big_fil_rev_8_21_14_0_10_34_12]
IQDRENLLFGRREIIFTMESSVSPSRAEVGKIVSEKFSTTPEKIKIKKITGKFGSNNFNVDISIYNSEEEKNKIERKRKKDTLHIPSKGQPVEEVKKEETSIANSQDGQVNNQEEVLSNKDESKSKDKVNSESINEDNSKE